MGDGTDARRPNRCAEVMGFYVQDVGGMDEKDRQQAPDVRDGLHFPQLSRNHSDWHSWKATHDQIYTVSDRRPRAPALGKAGRGVYRG